MSEFAVFGSGPLLIRGWIDESGDLDVICRGDAWQRVCQVGDPIHNDKYDVPLVELDDGKISFGTRWGIGNFDVSELIDGAEIIDELPFVQLQHVVAYKKIRANDKDMRHLEVMRKKSQAIGVSK